MYLSNKVTGPAVEKPWVAGADKSASMLLYRRQCHAHQQADLTNTVKHCSASLRNFAKPHNSPYKFKDSICNKSNTSVYFFFHFQLFFIALYNCMRLPYSGLLKRSFNSSSQNTITYLELKNQNSEATGFATGTMTRRSTACTNIFRIFPQSQEQTPE
jgi:hypothetical protein